MDSLLLLGSQVGFVAALTLFSEWRIQQAARLLAALCLALLIPAVLTSWLLLFGVPISIGRIASTVALVGGTAILFRRRGNAKTHLSTLRWSLLVPFSIPFGMQIIGASLKPVSAVDGLLYHGAALANIVTNDSLFGWSSVNEYVYYTELQMVLNALWLDLTGIVRMEDAVQTPYILIAALSVYVLSSQTTKYQLTRAWLSTAAVVAPVIWMQARVLYLDVAASALLSAGVALLVTAWRAGDRSSAVVAALALGGAAATKPSALLASLFCLALGTALLLRPLGWRLLAPSFIGYGLAAAPFFVRNVVAFGNPLYPVAMQLGPINFEGVIDPDKFIQAGGGSTRLVDFARIEAFVDDLWFGVSEGTSRWLYAATEGGFDRAPAFFVIALGLFACCLLLARFATSNNRRAPWSMELPAAASWATLVTALALVAITPNPTNSRYLIPSYLLLVGFGLSLFSVAPKMSGLDTAFASATALLAVGAMLFVESKMLFGIPNSLSIVQNDAEYNTGIDGNTVAYQGSFAWLRGSQCPNVLAQTEGGLLPQGMRPQGLLTTYQYGLWGDSLCNSVSFVPISDPLQTDSQLDNPSTRAKIFSADFIVIDDRYLDAWTGRLREMGLSFRVVHAQPIIPGSAYFSEVGQLVLEVVR